MNFPRLKAHQSLQQLDAIQMSKAAALHEEGQARLEQDDYEAAINLFRQAAALDIQVRVSFGIRMNIIDSGNFPEHEASAAAKNTMP